VDLGPGYYVNAYDHVRAALHADVTVGLRLMLGGIAGRRRVRLSVDPELGYTYESFPVSPTHAVRAGFAVMFHLFRGWLAVGPALSFVIGSGDGDLALGGRVEARVLLLQRIMVLQAGYEVLHAAGLHHQFRMVVGFDVWAVVRLGLNLMKPRPWALM
jgi:hypothetical protein